MAESSSTIKGLDNTSDIGGYAVELVNDELNRYRCPLCERLLRNPMQASCGDRFCASCAAHFLRSVLLLDIFKNCYVTITSTVSPWSAICYSVSPIHLPNIIIVVID